MLKISVQRILLFCCFIPMAWMQAAAPPISREAQLMAQKNASFCQERIRAVGYVPMQGQVNALYGDRGTLERISLKTLLQKKSETLTYEEAAEIQAFWALMRLKILTIEWEVKQRGFWGKVSSFLLGFWIFDLMGQLFNRFYFLASRAIRWLYVTSINLATQVDKTQKVYVLSETSPEEARLFLEQEHQKNQPVFTGFYAQDTRLSKAFLIQKAQELSLYQLYQSYYISQYLSPNPPMLQQSYPAVSVSQNVIDKGWANF